MNVSIITADFNTISQEVTIKEVLREILSIIPGSKVTHEDLHRSRYEGMKNAIDSGALKGSPGIEAVLEHDFTVGQKDGLVVGIEIPIESGKWLWGRVYRNGFHLCGEIPVDAPELFKVRDYVLKQGWSSKVEISNQAVPDGLLLRPPY